MFLPSPIDKDVLTEQKSFRTTISSVKYGDKKNLLREKKTHKEMPNLLISVLYWFKEGQVLI